MIAAYQRVSRADGDLGKDGKDKSNSIENQKELILRYISCKESLQNTRYCKSIAYELNFKKGCAAHVVTSKNVL